MVVSKVQTRGRGRAGKTWESPRGGLWFSVVLRPEIKPSKAGLLQILAAVATRDAIEKETGQKVTVKWPNDLVLQSGKLGGILVETKIVADTVYFVIMGIGVNVNQTRTSLPRGAVSLYTTTRRRFSLPGLLGQILQDLESRYQELENPSRLVSEWWKNCEHHLKIVRIESPQGFLIGLNKGIDESARLIVETSTDTVVKISEGTLRILGEQRH